MKTAVVTGGTKGIGLAIAKELIADGYRVLALYAGDTHNAAARRTELDPDDRGAFLPIKAPLETEEQVFTAIGAITEITDSIETLVLNSGTTDRSKWSTTSWEQWRHVMDVNINAPAALVRGLDRHLVPGGAILIVSSSMAKYPHASSVAYTVSKGALNSLAQALVKEYAERSIRVNSILPGFVETDWQKNKAADQRQRICDKVALHRFADPSEIADMAMAIIRSSYMNGALVSIDGGYSYR